VETSLLCRKTSWRLVTPQFISPALLCAALAAAGSATAANWEVAPRVEAGYRYNDNYHLRPPGEEVEVDGAEADAQLTLRTVDPRTQVAITPRVIATYFPDQPEDDSVDYFLDASLRDDTPRRRVGVVGEFSREDVSRSELPGGDVDGGELGNPVEGDSGRFVVHNRRNFGRIAPFFRYDLTQRQRLELDAQYLQADFEKEVPGAQQDYSKAGASVGWGYQFSQRSSLMLRGVASQYETTFDSNSYGAYVQWDTTFSETSRFYVRIGGQQTELASGETDTSVLSGIGGSWNSPRNTLFLDITRTVEPVAAGTVVERYQLRMQINHDVSPRLTLLLGVRGSHDEEIDETGTFPTRKYAAAEGGFEWRVLRNFAVTGTYGYRWQEYADELSDRSSNGFLIGMVYEPRRTD
jgi:hypothetical protein